jgi:hypothetical protein
VHIVRAPDVDLVTDVDIIAGQTVTATFAQSCPAIPPAGEGEGEGEPPQPPATGGVHGHVCMLDGSTNLAGATVSVDLADGTRRSTTTDGNGDWQLDDLPVGVQTVTIQAGSFSTTQQVTVTADAVVAFPESDCAIGQEGVKIAVVTGIWDDVYSVLMDVGVDPNIVDRYDQETGIADLMGDPALLATYDAVLVNCGADETDWQEDSSLHDNLRNYVLAGGSLYVSDLAYDVVEHTFPEFVNFVGNDGYYDDAQVGDVGDVDARVVDAAVQASLGTQQLTLHYPYSIWAVIEDTAPSVRVIIRGDAWWTNDDTFETGMVADAPHTVTFRPAVGSGKVVFSSFHQEPGIDVQQERVLQMLMFQL